MGSGTVGGPAINTTRARQFSPESVRPRTLEPQSRGDQEAQAADGGRAEAGSVREWGNRTRGKQAGGEEENPGRTEGGGGKHNTGAEEAE